MEGERYLSGVALGIPTISTYIPIRMGRVRRNDMETEEQIPINITVMAWARKPMTKTETEVLEDDLRQFLGHYRYRLHEEKFVEIEQDTSGVSA